MRVFSPIYLCPSSSCIVIVVQTDIASPLAITSSCWHTRWREEHGEGGGELMGYPQELLLTHIQIGFGWTVVEFMGFEIFSFLLGFVPPRLESGGSRFTGFEQSNGRKSLR